MKKRSRLRSSLAIMLAFIMLLQQTMTVVWASDDTFANAEVQVEPTTTAEPTEVPVEPTVEPVVTEAPVQEPSDVPEPTDSVEPTEAPTEPSDVPAEPTVTVEPTETPVDSSTPEPTEAPTVTPTPEPAYKNEFSISQGWGSANVSLSGEKAMLEKAEFFVEGKDMNSNYFASAYNLVESYAQQHGKVLLDGNVYNVGFRVDGQEVEPSNGTANVFISFYNPLNFDIQDIEGAAVRVFHIENGQAVDVTTDVSLTGDRKVSAVRMLLSSFSPVVIAAVVDESVIAATDAAAMSSNVFVDPICEFRNNGESVESVFSGQAFTLHTELGIAQNNANDISEITIDLTGYGDLVLTQFPGKGKVSETITIADSGVQARLEVLDGKKVVHITRVDGKEFENGATYTLDLGASFPNGFTANGESATATLKGNDSVIASDTISANSEPKWKHAKTANISETTLTKEGNAPKLNTDIQYSLYNYGTTYASMEENRNPAGNTNYNNIIGELYVNGLEVTDTLMLPTGMYLEEVSDAAVMFTPDNTYNQGWTNIAKKSVTPIKDAANRIIGFTLVYTVTPTDAMKGYQLAGSKVNVTLNKDKLKFDSDYKTGTAENELATTYTTVDGASHTVPDNAKVDVTFNEPKTINWENAVSKSIESSTAQGNKFETKK